MTSAGAVKGGIALAGVCVAVMESYGDLWIDCAAKAAATAKRALTAAGQLCPQAA